MDDTGFNTHSHNLLENQSPQYPPRRQISLLDPANFAVRQNLSLAMHRGVNDSIHYNVSLIAFSVIKSLASLIVLCITNPECDKAIREWTIYSIIHDLMYSFALALKVKTIFRSGHDPSTRTDRNVEGDFARDIFGYHLSNDESVFTISEEAERRNRWVSAFTAVCKTFYYVLFIYAQILYFHTDPTCPEEPTTLMDMMILYILLSYIFIGMPIAFIILACICLPFVLLFSYIFSKGAQTPVSKDTLKKLSTVNFSASLPGNHECSICMSDYEEGDKLIQLRCSPMHHFHDDCLKKWLGINGLCPICRADIEESVQGPKSGDLEMATTVQSIN